MANDVAVRIKRVRMQVESAAARAGRHEDITVVAVSKTVQPDAIKRAYDAGHRVFGENRVQEALPKIATLRASMPEARWHLIGHLQSNKAKQATQSFSMVESVDSLRLAQILEKRAADGQVVLPVLLEVNVAGEGSKTGFPEPDFWSALPDILVMEHLRVDGLMTVAPLVPDPEDVRWVFRRLRQMRDQAHELNPSACLSQLSMGMSGDFEVAIEEGATMVRIGRAIFGERSVAARKA